MIGGPPCQAFSRLRHMVEANGYTVAENRIPEFERIVENAKPEWFLMENVPAAPMPICAGWVNDDVIVRDVWVGGSTSRERRFTFGRRARLNGAPLSAFHVETLALHRPDPEQAILASGGRRETPVAIGGSGKRKRRESRLQNEDYLARAVRLSGLPDGFLDHAPFTVSGKIKVIGNGVPLPMGRAVANAVRRAIGMNEQFDVA